MRNYDLNIWDELAYRTDGRKTGGWKINAYEIVPYHGGFTCGDMLPDELTLTRENVKTLGFHPDVDDDIWIDSKHLVENYTVPRRVLRWLESLPQEEG